VVERLSQSFLAPGDEQLRTTALMWPHRGTTVPCREGVCDRWSLALDPTSRKGAKARRRVVVLAKDPGCDGAWANGGKLDSRTFVSIVFGSWR